LWRLSLGPGMHRRRLLGASASAVAAALAGCTGGGSEDETTTGTTTENADSATDATTGDTETTTERTETATTEAGTGGGSGEATVVTVAPSGEIAFSPESVTVEAGTTVRWEWDGSGHNVRPASQPADADWTGTAGGDGETYGSEHVYEHTFEVAGRYDYYCAPHRSIGMRASVVVE